MSESRGFKGIWIPKEIWQRTDLSPLEKCLLAEINSLDKGNGCRASNKYLAKFCQISESHLANMLTELRKKGLLIDRGFNGRKRLLSVHNNGKAEFPDSGRQSSQISEPYKEELLEEIKEKDIKTTKDVVLSGQAANESERSSVLPIAEKKKAPRWDSTRWYNTEYARLFKQVSGRPALTKPKQYGQAKTYFALLTECNPNAPPQEIYQIATEGAGLVFGSYQHGGPFSWLTTRPDIGVLASQAEKIYDTLMQIKNIPEEELIEQEETANAVAELNAINEKILAAGKRNQETSPIANALGSGYKIPDRCSRH